jgi:protein-L-isoaspartate(D-aspartate) O-methyltransferase
MDEHDLDSLRQKMVKTQLQGRDIRDLLTLEAMRRVPRERFVPEKYRSRAYDDCPLPIGEQQTISQPYMVALMTEALGLSEDERVLEIGTGSGYQTAILAEIASEVYSIERIPLLARKAESTLETLGYTNIMVMARDGTQGDPEHAPFDAIIVTAGSPGIPVSLKEQLAQGGRLVIPVGSRGFQELTRITRRGSAFMTENLGGCVFVPLIGIEGWEWR